MDPNGMQLKVSLCQWLLSLPEDAPALQRLDGIRRGELPAECPPERQPGEERLLSLKEVSQALGFKSYTMLTKLKVRRVGIMLGGRPRYRVCDVQKYLNSPECERERERLRVRDRQSKGSRKRKEAAMAS